MPYMNILKNVSFNSLKLYVFPTAIERFTLIIMTNVAYWLDKQSSLIISREVIIISGFRMHYLHIWMVLSWFHILHDYMIL